MILISVSLVGVVRYRAKDDLVTLAEVSAMLTLGSKYQINPLQEEATRLLRECFPEQLEDYVTPHTSAYLHMFINHDHYPGLPKSYSSKSAVKLEHWDCVAVVNLARKFDLDFVLPAAFYACAQMHTEDLFRAVRCSDGKAHKLSQSDLQRVVDGRAQLCIFTVQSYRWLINGPPYEPKIASKQWVSIC